MSKQSRRLPVDSPATMECPRCGAPLASSPARRFPVLAPAVVLLGCLLTFYLVGFAFIALGAWLWTRRAGPPSCPACGSAA